MVYWLNPMVYIVIVNLSVYPFFADLMFVRFDYFVGYS
jgi:hypothetical protein